MQYYDTLTNSEINYLIGEYIHSERNRRILRYKLIDGYTYEHIAEIEAMSPRQIKTIVKQCAAAMRQSAMN